MITTQLFFNTKLVCGMQKKRTIADLEINETAVIAENQEENIPLKLIQMGCTCNTKIVLRMKAPSSDPLCIQIGGNDIALRIEEAQKIYIKSL
tara:strand:- start:650 stop:928 length:279 start_codon:yes stop_codon:yes gene_type:complete